MTSVLGEEGQPVELPLRWPHVKNRDPPATRFITENSQFGTWRQLISPSWMKEEVGEGSASVIPLALGSICRAKAWGACAMSSPGSSFQARALLTYRPSMLPTLTTFRDPIFHSTDTIPSWLWLTVREVKWSGFLFVCFYDKYLKKII